MDSGAAGPEEPVETDPVLAALSGARAISRSQPASRSRRRKQAAATADTADGQRRGGYSGPGPDATDPQPVGAVVAGYLADRGWERPLAEARVFTDWANLVGPEIAAHCEPAALREGELRISAESTAWATQLRLLQARLLARLVGELGPEVVTKVIITGPVGPSWKHGHRSVRGARGPRDTYG